MSYAKDLAKAALQIRAIKLSPEEPFTWASGFRMPIYNDNRLFLGYPKLREMIAESFADMVDTYFSNYSNLVIAGTSTAGISPATTLADYLELPIIYLRDKPKDHGLKNQIEGVDADSNLSGKNVIVIEDLISTGGSSVKAVNAVQNAKGNCKHCFSIFTYGFKKAEEMFSGKIDYETGKKLSESCIQQSIFDYDLLLEVAKEVGYLPQNEIDFLKNWREDPFSWGAKHGFPQINKS